MTTKISFSFLSQAQAEPTANNNSVQQNRYIPSFFIFQPPRKSAVKSET